MRKLISLLLAAVITVGMTATVFAANPKITEQAEALADVSDDYYPGAKIFIPFVEGAFAEATEDLTASDVRTSKITVKHTIKSGSKAIGSVAIKEDSSKKAGILVTLVDPFTSTKPLDFEVVCTLYIDGKRQQYSTSVSGTLSNPEMEVYSDTDYVDLSDGTMAVCVENATKVEAFLGEGVSMFVRMVKGKNYMGVASTDPTDNDIEIFDQYTDITDVYNLSVNGLSGTGKFVAIDPGQTLYVYDGDLNYLGTTDSMLPFSEKYFTAINKLDVIDDSEDEFLGEEDFIDDEGFSGDEEFTGDEDFLPEDIDGALPAVSGTASGNNPDTGIPPLFGVSLVAGIISLGAMGLTYFKKEK